MNAQAVRISEFYKNTIKRLLLKEKLIFLKKCINLNILLPSNKVKGMDLDLLLIQQKRKLYLQIKEMEVNIKDNKRLFDKLNSQEKNHANVIILRKKNKYKRKISWLSCKQKKLSINNGNIPKFFPNSKAIKNKKDRKRYLQRKKHRLHTSENKDFNEIILNKSNLELNNYDKELLSYGNQFIPTPRWEAKVAQKERENLLKHIRSVEWQDYFKNKEISNDKQCDFILSNKLRIPNFSRPERSEISKDTKSYVQTVINKFKDLKHKVINMYKFRNNLNKNLQLSLRKLRKKTQNKEIVIGHSDKDRKTIIVNYKNYITLIKQALEKNYETLPYNEAEIKQQINMIKEEMTKILIKMWENKSIDNDLLYRTSGYKKAPSGNLRKCTGSTAKYFANENCGFIYPLWKTHKLSPEELRHCNITEIPIRVVQAAGNTYLCRYTAFLNHILDVISIRYCKFKVNEYCKDSKSYLEDLLNWKKSLQDKNCIISTVDVVNLYPSLSIDLVERALTEALITCSDYNPETINNIISLCKMGLNNNFIQFQDIYYKQKTGIITGDNNSVTIANIALHFIMIRVPQISETLLIKRFIDDIILIAQNDFIAEQIIENIKEEFQKYGLQITSKTMSTKDKNNMLPFLDVQHILIKEGNNNFFKTKNFIKKTAENSTFLNGKSYHPLNVFKGIITGESKRMRRLNETDEDYKDSLKILENKCLKSNFNPKLVTNQFKKIQQQLSNFDNNLNKKDKSDNLYWSSQFRNLLKFTKDEAKLVPQARTSFTEPRSLGQYLNTFSSIAKTTKAEKKIISKKCNKCALCGHYNKYNNMVDENEIIKTKENRKIKISSTLNCKNYGIYAARCLQCNEFYVGQTKNSFNTRWNTHRMNWKKFQRKFNLNDNSDESALFKHYFVNHRTVLENLALENAYNVIFIEEPNLRNLDYKESIWIKKLEAKINISRTIYSELI